MASAHRLPDGAAQLVARAAFWGPARFGSGSVRGLALQVTRLDWVGSLDFNFLVEIKGFG